MDNLFFIASKVLFLFIKPSNFLLITIIIYISFFLIKKKSFYKQLTIFISLLFFITIFWIFVIESLHFLEKRFVKPQNIDSNIKGIVVLGGSENANLTKRHNLVNLNSGSERLLESLVVAEKINNINIYFLGGSGFLNFQEFNEVDVAKKFYEDLKFDMSKVIFVDGTRNTFENMKKFLNEVKPEAEDKFLLITSAFHMPRSMSVARKLKLNFIPYPVDHRIDKDLTLIDNLQTFSFAQLLGFTDHLFKEYLGLFAYRAFGKSDSFLP